MAEVKDFRKWVSFNNLLSNHEHLYDLFKSIESKSTMGSVSFNHISDEEQSIIVIEQEGYDSTLNLESNEELGQFLDYLKKFYLPDQDIESWYKSKTSHLGNHLIGSSTLQSNSQTHNSVDNFEPYSKETYYYYLRLFVSCVFYLAIVIALTLTYFDTITAGLISTAIATGLFLFLFLLRRIVHGIFIGIIRGNSIKASKNQFPEVYEQVKEQASQLGFKETPEVYIAGGHFNSFVTSFARKKYLLLFSEVIETATGRDKEVLKFVIGHELCHLKRKHVEIEKWLFPSRIIPFLSLAHSRACEYSCDRMGYHFSKTGAIEGIVILSAGKEIYSQVNIESFIEDSKVERSFWVWFSEKFLTHPHIFKRMLAIKNYDGFQ